MDEEKLSTTISEIICDWENAFPNRIISWYLLGSYADNTATSKSDLDIVFVTNQDCETTEGQKKAESICKTYLDKYPLKIDIWGLSREELIHLGRSDSSAMIHAVSIKYSGKLIKGSDIRQQILDPKADEYSRKLVEIAERWCKNFPYTRQDKYIGLVDKESSSPLIYIVQAIAAALSVQKTSKFLNKRSDICPHYQNVITDQWTSLVKNIDLLVWKKWEARIPAKLKEREELSILCQDADRFRKFFLLQSHRILHG